MRTRAIFTVGPAHPAVLGHRHQRACPRFSPHAGVWSRATTWEWPEGQELPEHYWLSTMPADTPLERLVYLAKLRWRVERDYQEMKAAVGLDHYEGRTWAGLHHHWVLCSMAHGFLVLQRARWQRQQTAAPVSPPGSMRSQKKTAHTDEFVAP